MSRRCGVMAIFLFSASVLMAADGVWTNATSGAWEDSANWLDGVVAGGSATDTAWFTNTVADDVFVKLPAQGVMLGKVTADSTKKIFRGGPLLCGPDGLTLSGRGYYLSAVQGAGDLILDGNIDIKSASAYDGDTVLKSGSSGVHLNHAAASTNAVDGNLLSTNALVFAGGNLTFHGRPNHTRLVQYWNATAGETLITRPAVSNGNATAGVRISGAGIADGTYVKSILGHLTYELSQPATQSGVLELTFETMTFTELRQQFTAIVMNASGTLTANMPSTIITKIEAGELVGDASRTLTKNGPGTLALGKADAFQGKLSLQGGVLQLSAAPEIFSGELILAAGVRLQIPDSGTETTGRLAAVTANGRAEIEVTGADTVVVIDDLAGTGELIKTGAGTLRVNRTDGNATVTVRSGNLLIDIARNDMQESETLAAAWFHTDASAADSLVTETINGTNFVSSWSDVRANGLSANKNGTNPRPFVVTNAQNGLNILDFGGLKADGFNGHGGYLEWIERSSAIRETFVIFSDTPDVTGSHNFYLGYTDSNIYHFHRGDNGQMLHSSHAAAALRNGVCLDMERIPSPTTKILPSGFHLVSLAATGGVSASTFGRDRNSRYGGIRLGEALVYTNELSSAQRYAVNHYLMRKWFHVPSLFARLNVEDGATLTVADGSDLLVDTLTFGENAIKEGGGTVTTHYFDGPLVVEATDTDRISLGNGIFVRQGGALPVESLTQTNGTTLLAAEQTMQFGWLETKRLVKTGGGDLNVGLLSRSVERIDVEDGTLTMDGTGGCGAWFHVDAADENTLTTVLENGTNFVTNWRDVRNNGIYAGVSGASNRPWLQRNEADGRPFVDFGAYVYGANSAKPYLEWNRSCSSIRAAFLVFSDSPGSTKSFVLGDAKHNTYHFHREETGTGALLESRYAHANLRNGRLMIDERVVEPTTVLPEGFNVLSLISTGPVVASAFARDRNHRYGGQRLSEVLIFDTVLPTGVQQAVTGQLLAKWKGIHLMPREIAAVHVAQQGVLDSPYELLEIGALDGSGTVRAAAVQATAVSAGDTAGEIGTLALESDLILADGAAVTVDCAGQECDLTTVSGALTIAGGGTVQLNGTLRVTSGESLALFTFDSLNGEENLAQWRVTGAITQQYAVRLVADGNSIRAVFMGKGTIIMLN